MERLVVVIRDLSGGGAERFVSELFIEDVELNFTDFTLVCEDTKQNRLLANEAISNLSHVFFLKWSLFEFTKNILKLNADFSRPKFLTFLNSASIRVCLAKLLSFGKIQLFVCQRSDPIKCLSVELFFQKLRHLCLYVLLFNVADKIICNSQGILESTNRLCFIKRKSYFFDSWLVPKKLISIVETDTLPDGEKYYCCVGSLTKIKCFQYVIESFVKSDLPEDVGLKIIGDGPLRAEIENWLAVHQCSERIKLLGWQSDPFPVMRHAIGLIHGSLTEGCSNVISEALALGTPVIASSSLKDSFSNPFQGSVTYFSNDSYSLVDVLNRHAFGLSVGASAKAISNHRAEISKKFITFIRNL